MTVNLRQVDDVIVYVAMTEAPVCFRPSVIAHSPLTWQNGHVPPHLASEDRAPCAANLLVPAQPPDEPLTWQAALAR